MAYSNQVGYFSPERHPWLFVKAESGGMLVEQAIHNLDIWLWLYGPASTVYGFTSHVPLGGTYPPPDQAVENNAVLTVHFKNGGVGMMIKSWAAEIRNSGNGLVASKGSADTDSARSPLENARYGGGGRIHCAGPRRRHLSQHARGTAAAAILGSRGERREHRPLAPMYRWVNRNRQRMDASVETVSS